MHHLFRRLLSLALPLRHLNDAYTQFRRFCCVVISRWKGGPTIESQRGWVHILRAALFNFFTLEFLTGSLSRLSPTFNPETFQTRARSPGCYYIRSSQREVLVSLRPRLAGIDSLCPTGSNGGMFFRIRCENVSGLSASFLTPHSPPAISHLSLPVPIRYTHIA